MINKGALDRHVCTRTLHVYTCTVFQVTRNGFRNARAESAAHWSDTEVRFDREKTHSILCQV